MPHDAAALVDDLTPDFVDYQRAMNRAAEATALQANKHAERYAPPKGDTLPKIKAQFDGQEREFTVERKYIPILESALGRGAYAVLKDFTEGNWRFNDVAAVISFALHGPTANERMALQLARSAAMYGMPAHVYTSPPASDVLAVLQRDGHGNYASLAADILTAAIFGETQAEPADAA